MSAFGSAQTKHSGNINRNTLGGATLLLIPQVDAISK